MSGDRDAMGRKPFQEATVQHAVEKLCAPGGSRRFLVADEVGLGKTLVAQGILQKLSLRQPGLNVFYVCSSLTIAHQNRDSLLEVLPPDLRKNAWVKVDRPTLLPLTDPPRDQAFTLFTLTPGTMPVAGAASGRVDERAALWCLLREGLRGARSLDAIESKLKRVKDTTWDAALADRSSASMQNRIARLAPDFVTDLRKMLRLEDTSVDALARGLNGALEVDLLRTVQRLRRRLARLGFASLRPDLVILDEFQRFSELLEVSTPAATVPAEGAVPPSDDDQDANALLRLLFEARHDGKAPAILLLSATPYRLPSGLVDGSTLRHYSQFFRLLQFLFGPREAAEVPRLRELFRRYGSLLHEAPAGSVEVFDVRDEIERHLGEVLARTERASMGAAEGANPTRIAAALNADDVRIYRHLWESSRVEDRGYATAYWSSIPYPLQMMDRGYVLRAHASCKPMPQEVVSKTTLVAASLRQYANLPIPHPRMRALIHDLPTELLGLPWMPPLLPWWPLEEPFKRAAGDASGPTPSKVLLFSRFRAVPRAIASTITYEAERRVFSEATNTRGRSYDYTRRRRSGDDSDSAIVEGAKPLHPLPSRAFAWGGAGGESDHLLLATFAPAPVLSDLGDPQTLLRGPSPLSRSDALLEVLKRLREELERRTAGRVQVDAGASRTGQLWKALVLLERTGQRWPEFTNALSEWSRRSRSRYARDAVERWIRLPAAPAIEGVVRISEVELEELAELALCGPGNTLFRAARRVFGEVSDTQARLALCTDIALGPLRTYLDEPEFHLTLDLHPRRGAGPDHRRAVRRAVWSGNLEAVFDEYLATGAGLGAARLDPNREAKVLSNLRTALSVRVSNVEAQNLEGEKPLQLRCHVAMAFGLPTSKDEGVEGDSGEARPDALRLAFNSPFRPFVLATTSIGQEGLDFHLYCNHLVHWDLPSSPVDLEQRDGRVNRYGGLGIRAALARDFQAKPPVLEATASRWMSWTRQLPETNHGLAPWWGYEGAQIRRTVFLPPLAQQEQELNHLLDGLSHYRLALGQPDAEQLLRSIRRRLDAARSEDEREALLSWLRAASINLSPLIRRPKAAPT